MTVVEGASANDGVETSRFLALFSSNIRPQYEQDIINVLAGPRDQLYRFRYSEDIVDGEIREKWEQNSLKDDKDLDVLVVFSIQQPDRYHDPAYVPVRRGKVVQSLREGSLFVVYFKLGDYVSLRCADGKNLGSMTGDDFGAMVRNFTDELNDSLNGSPRQEDKAKRYSASMSKVPPHWPPPPTPGEVEATFELVSAYLQRTVSFNGSYFWRVSGISGPKEGQYVASTEPGLWRLLSEHSYTLKIMQFQPKSVGQIGTFDISSDPSLLQVVGDSSFTIASGYDEIPIFLRVPLLSSERDTVLTIRPHPGTSGPSANLRFRVGPQNGARLRTAGAGAGAAVFAAIPSITNLATPLKVTSVVLSAGLLAFVGYRGIPGRTAG